MKNIYLESYIDELKKISSEVEEEFSGLNGEQLNWKPGGKSWSIGQCLEHLIISNSKYFPVMTDIAEGRKDSSFWESIPFLPKVWGRMLIKSVKEDSKKKVKTPKLFRPSSGIISTSIVNDFVNHQNKLIEVMLKTEGIEHSMIITSPAAKMITYSLRDANTIIVNHERRHFYQAKRVKESINFPK